MIMIYRQKCIKAFILLDGTRVDENERIIFNHILLRQTVLLQTWVPLVWFITSLFRHFHEKQQIQNLIEGKYLFDIFLKKKKSAVIFKNLLC